MKKKFRELLGKNAIFDLNLIFDLQELGIPYLPMEIFNEVYISKSILTEELSVEEGHNLVNAGYSPLNLETNKGLDNCRYLKQSHKPLSMQDILAVSIAHEKEIVCCTNDHTVRNACKDIGVAEVGILGLICSAFENNAISRTELIILFNQGYSKVNSPLNSILASKIRYLYKIPNQLDASYKIL